MNTVISNHSVLDALYTVAVDCGFTFTTCQDWFIDTLRRAAGEGTDAREGLGYTILCESLNREMRARWLVTHGYSIDGQAHPAYVAELAELTPHLQNAVDYAIAHGERVEEQVAA